MLTLCDCSMAKQWSIKTNLEKRDRSWCETGSERLVTGSGEREREREREPDVAWWIVVLYRAQGILGNHLFVLSCHAKACPLVTCLCLHNDVAKLFKVYPIAGRYDINIAGLRPCQPLGSMFFCVLCMSRMYRGHLMEPAYIEGQLKYNLEKLIL